MRLALQFFALIIALPSVVLALDDESLEAVLEVVNLSLSLVALGISFYASRFVGGIIKKSWNYVVVAIVIYAVYEFLGVIKDPSLGIFRELMETLFIISLIISLYTLQASLKQFFTKPVKARKKSR